jgi:hypothetical protein
MTTAALRPRRTNRYLLLVEHCLPLESVSRPPVRDRLEAALGAELSRRLVVALTRDRVAY